jgi:hypothetical protein
MLSETDKFCELTVVVVPRTCKLPPTINPSLVVKELITMLDAESTEIVLFVFFSPVPTLTLCVTKSESIKLVISAESRERLVIKALVLSESIKDLIAFEEFL